MRPYVSLTVTSVLLSALLFVAAGCTQSPGDASKEKSADKPAAVEGEASAGEEKATTPEAAEGATSTAPAEPEEGTVPEAIQDLKEKIQPSGITPEKGTSRPGTAAEKKTGTKSGTEAARGTPSTTIAAPVELSPEDEKAMLAQSTEFVGKFVEALQKGDTAAAETMMFTRELFAEVVSPGHRDILEGHVLTANADLLKRLVASLQGKTLEHSWEPGKVLTTRPRSPFIKSRPTINKAVLAVTADGARLEIVMEQLVYVDGSWYIFRFSTP